VLRPVHDVAQQLAGDQRDERPSHRSEHREVEQAMCGEERDPELGQNAADQEAHDEEEQALTEPALHGRLRPAREHPLRHQERDEDRDQHQRE
jgi:hypothetical protein